MISKRTLRKQVVVLCYQLEMCVRVLESNELMDVFQTAAAFGTEYAGEKINTKLIRKIVRECGYEFSTTKVIEDEDSDADDDATS